MASSSKAEERMANALERLADVAEAEYAQKRVVSEGGEATARTNGWKRVRDEAIERIKGRIDG